MNRLMRCLAEWWKPPVAANLLSQPAAGPASPEAGDQLRPKYEHRCPSAQTIADIFAGSWKSRLPGVLTETIDSSADMFNSDVRVSWLDSILPGGLNQKQVCEIGPFEGYQSLQLKQHGVLELISVEANSFNFLKCLCVKEIYKLAVEYQLGDGISYLENCQRRFDLIFASGVLYHLQEPFRFLELATGLTDHLYIWTHYFSPTVLGLTNGQEKHFHPALDREVQIMGTTCRLHARSYNIPNYRDNIPAYWEGGLQDITYWIEKDQLLTCLSACGFGKLVIHYDGQLNGLPVLSFYAARG